MKHRRVLTTVMTVLTTLHLLELQTARPEPVVGCATHGAKDSADDVIALKARKVLSPNSGESGSGRRRSSRRQQQRRGRRRREGGRRRRRSPRSRTMRRLLLLLRRRDEPRGAQYALVAPTASTASVAERGRSWGKWLRAWRRSWAVWPWRVCGRQQRWPEQSAMPLRRSAVSLLGSRRQ